MTSPEEFFSRFTREVFPLLQEYAYGDTGLLEELLGRDFVDVEKRAIRAVTFEDPYALVEALARRYGSDADR